MAENSNTDKVSADLDQIRTLVHSANQSIQDQTISAIDTIENRFTKFADSCDVLIQSLKLEMGELGQSFEKASGQLDKLNPKKNDRGQAGDQDDQRDHRGYHPGDQKVG